MKKIICLCVLATALLAENNVWLGIMDLAINNKGERIENRDLKEIENINVKFRAVDFINYVEKIFK